LARGRLLYARVASLLVPPNVDLARQQWAEGSRRIHELARDARARERLLGQVDALVEQLRRRVGSSYTLEELAASYHAAERWAYEALAERAEAPDWSASATAALDAAYHLYARGARDYSP
jgi:hypothetical protein